MDFEQVLHKAQKNEKKKVKEPLKCYRTTFAPPKKEEKTKGLSANIQKFLARKEEEERKKKIEEAKKKDELLALRNQDNKAKKRVQVMLKRTKSANKSVLVDAIDTVNTADTINGPQQCDEDDYGYVSQEASKFYKQMMEKYSAVPVEERKSFKPNNRATAKDLINTKDRVKQALLRQEEEENMPHKRKRKRKEDEEDGHENAGDHGSREGSEERERVLEKPKPKRPAMPPPMDFNSLLKIAEKKQFEPVVIEKKEVKREKEVPERLMTKKEKAEYERLKERDKKKNEAMKSSLKSRSEESDFRDQDRRKDREKLEKDRGHDNERERMQERKREDYDRPRDREGFSSSKHGSHRRHSPDLNYSSRSRSRSRSPISDRIGKIKQNHSASNSPASSSSIKSKEDVRRNISLETKQSSSVSRIPKIPKVNGLDKKFTEKNSDRDRIKERERDKEREREREREREKDREREKVREREKERERLIERGREKERELLLERERERDREKQRQKEREEREKLRDREREREIEKLREKQRELDREKERLRELERIREQERAREKAKERERYEKEKLYDRKEKEMKDNAQKKSSVLSEKEKFKLADGKKASKYNKLDLFGERDSLSPDRPKPSTKSTKPPEVAKKNPKPERIKIVEDSTRDLFDNPVTLVRKHNSNDGDKSKQNPKSISSKVDDKAKPSSSSSVSSSKANQITRTPLDKERNKLSGTPGRKNDSDEDKFTSDRKINSHSVQSRESKLGQSGFKKPFPPQSTSSSKQPISKDIKPRQFPPRDLQPKQFPPRDLQPKQFPPRDLQRKQFPPRDLKPKQFPPPDVRRNAMAKKRHEYERSDSEDSEDDEEEDEYDPDLDDFIDDGGVDDQEDYSEYIKKIFNYDKSKYIDDDSDIEESSFAQQMREECRSARLGLLEDLEDMAMEQQEKRRKALHKMKRGRR